MLRYLSLRNKPLRNIKLFVKSGAKYWEIMESFNLPEDIAKIAYVTFANKYPGDRAILGHKDIPYYEGDFPPDIPKYSIDDLKGDELEILKKLQNGENEGDLYRSDE